MRRWMPAAVLSLLAAGSVTAWMVLGDSAELAEVVVELHSSTVPGLAAVTTETRTRGTGLAAVTTETRPGGTGLAAVTAETNHASFGLAAVIVETSLPAPPEVPEIPEVPEVPEVPVVLALKKQLLEGPEEIGIALPEPTRYVFEITYSNPEPDVPVRVTDTVPAEFEILELDATAGNAIFFNTSNGRGNSADRIEWDLPVGTTSASVTVTIQTVASPGRGHKNPTFKPVSCGQLVLNDGATAFEVDPETGEIVHVEVLAPDTGEVTVEPVVIVGPSNSLAVLAVEGAKPCEDEDDEEKEDKKEEKHKGDKDKHEGDKDEEEDDEEDQQGDQDEQDEDDDEEHEDDEEEEDDEDDEEEHDEDNDEEDDEDE